MEYRKHTIKYCWGKRLFTGALILGWMLLIGSFSAQPGQESGSLSRAVADRALSVWEYITGEPYPKQEREARIEAMQFPIRKLAHMSEYAVLAVLLAFHFGTYRFGAVRLFLRLPLSWLAAAVYAAADEIHQLFVPGRSGQLTDVCIDAAGALAGVLAFGAAVVLVRRRGKSKN